MKVAVPLAVLLLLACAAGFVAVREPRMRGFRQFRDHKVKQQGGGGNGGDGDGGKPKVSTVGVSICRAFIRERMRACCRFHSDQVQTPWTRVGPGKTQWCAALSAALAAAASQPY